MDWLLIVLVVAAVAWGARQFAARRAPEPPEDDWVLPPEEGAAPSQPLPPLLPPPGMPGVTHSERLDRDALLNIDRTLDPTAWDDSPDSQSGTDVEEPGNPYG